MRVYVAVFMAATISLSAYATEPLHTYRASSVEFYATDHVENVDVEGEFVEFHLVDSGVFATALIFKDTRNQYPQLEVFSKQFLNTAYASSDNRVFGQIEVQSEFANTAVNGREFLIDAESGTCELILATSVGDRTYIFFYISDPHVTAKCEDSGRELRTIANNITASIAVSGN